jgi:putative phosphoesterase
MSSSHFVAHGVLNSVVGTRMMTFLGGDLNRMLVPNKMQHVICTGNMGSKEQYEELRNLSPNVHVVDGDFEYPGAMFPDTKVVQVGDFKIGIIHGHQVVPWGDQMALSMMRRKLDVDILISGHSHKNGVVEHEGHYHINPVRIFRAHDIRLKKIYNIIVWYTHSFGACATICIFLYTVCVLNIGFHHWGVFSYQ